MKQTTKKKGFTIVELVIVIAVVAILAAVLIPTFVNLTEKAKQSVDEQLCANYNKILQAECVMNEDITLGEFITVIEENGINSNHFNTSSKLYTFAFYSPDEGRKECVLLNKEDGTVLYPQHRVGSADVTPAKLWTTLDDKQQPQQGVYNYTLMNSVTYKAPAKTGINTGAAYTYDLQNNMILFSAEPQNEITVMNGTAVYSDTLHNVKNSTEKAPEYINSASNGTWGGVYDKASDLQAKVNGDKTGAANEYKVEGKQYFLTQKSDCTLNVGSATTTIVMFKNCTFSSVFTMVTAPNAEVIFDHCKFVNFPAYALKIDKAKSVDIHDCTFESCNRGINVLPATTTTSICNNTFRIDSTLTENKGERKDNAIQLNFDDPTHFLTESGLKDNGFKIEIKNNIIEKSKALITVHAGFAAGTTANTYAPTFLAHAVPKIEISGNTMGNAANVSVDPGMEEDVDNAIKGNKFDASEKQSRIETYNKIVEEIEKKFA